MCYFKNYLFKTKIISQNNFHPFLSEKSLMTYLDANYIKKNFEGLYFSDNFICKN